MKNNFFSFIYDFDIFSKKIGLYYKNKDNISSYFGLFLTLIYILTSLSVFIFSIIITYQKREFQITDSNTYSQDAPSIDLNNSDLFHFVLGVVNRNQSRFIDETIYSIRAIYFNQYKNSEGIFVSKEKRDLKLEKCQKEIIEKNYGNLLTETDLNNSYCIKNFDLKLTGGKIYNNFSYIEIQIYPCENTENFSNCKSQELISNALEGSILSIQLKNIELNPNNYSFPILSTVYEFYTSISKYIYKNICIFYKITEVELNSGIFYEKKKTIQDLKLDNIKENFYYSDNNIKEKMISKIEIRLSDNIHIQRRIYQNIFNAFAITGGYAQILYNFFSLLCLFYNKYKFEIIIINDMIGWEIKSDRKSATYINDKRNTLFVDNSKFGLNNNKKLKDINQKDNINFLDNNNLKRGSLCIESLLHLKSKKSNNFPSINDFVQFSFMDQSNNVSKDEISPNTPVNARAPREKSLFDQSMMSMNRSLNRSINKSINQSINRSINKSRIFRSYSNFFNILRKRKVKKIKLNVFDYYYCLGNTKKQKEIELLKKCSSIYKERLDSINLFKDLLILDNFFKENVHYEKNGANEELNFFSNKKIFRNI
jgi:hypothetical protein